MDQEAFIPLKSAEISPDIARRYIHYSELVEEVIRKGVADRSYSIEGLRSSGGQLFYGRYFRMGICRIRC